MTHPRIYNKLRAQAEAEMLEAIEGLSSEERSERLERAHERGAGSEFTQTVAVAELVKIVAGQQARIEALESKGKSRTKKSS